MFKTDTRGKPLLRFDEALDELVEWYLARGADAGAIASDLRDKCYPPGRRELAQALRSADWSNTSIGNKALIQAAIAAFEIQTAIGQEQVRHEGENGSRA